MIMKNSLTLIYPPDEFCPFSNGKEINLTKDMDFSHVQACFNFNVKNSIGLNLVIPILFTQVETEEKKLLIDEIKSKEPFKIKKAYTGDTDILIKDGFVYKKNTISANYDLVGEGALTCIPKEKRLILKIKVLK